MCTRTDHDGACETCARTDEWVAPADLRRPAPASMSGPLAPEQPEDVHGPALTPAAFSERLRALGRDGGER